MLPGLPPDPFEGCLAPPERDSRAIPCAVMSRVIRVGVQLPEVEREVRWPELLDMARAIDDLGFDGIWLGEHLLYRWRAGRRAGRGRPGR